MKRILSLILSLVLILSMLPAQALAEENPMASGDSSAAVEAASEPAEPVTSSQPASTEDSSQPELTVTVTAEDNLTELAVGDRLPLTARVSPETEDAAVVWASSDEAVATVDQNGLVTGVAPGSVTITARVGDAQGSYALTVTRPQSGFLSDTDVILSGSCGAQGDNLTFTLTQGGVLTITGKGEMTSYPLWSNNSLQITSVILEEGVTSIGRQAFAGCSSLESVSIPEGVTGIGRQAFFGCSSLESVTIPEGVTGIGEQAFYTCSSLGSITIPESVTSIGDEAFSGCRSLTSVTIPEGVTSIGERVFYECSSLESVSIPEGVTSIGNLAFRSCSSLGSITIPKSVTSIGDWAFRDCQKLTSVTIPEGVTSIGEYAFFECYYLSCFYFLGDGFYPSNYICNGYTTAYYPRGNATWTQEIRDSFGTRVTWVEACLNHTVVIDPGKEATCTETGLTEGSHCGICQEILVPQVVIPITHRFENNICTRCGIYGGACGENLTWTLADGRLVISGAGDMEAVAEGKAPWYGLRDQITTLDILPGVTSVGNYAFAGCANLTQVVLPEGLTTIGSHAFRDCAALEELRFPASVTDIGSQILTGSGVTELYFCADLPQIAWNAFDGINASAAYPENNPTWTPMGLWGYSGTIVWTPATARTFTLELQQNYLALSLGESAQLTLRTDIPLSAEAYTWAVEECEGVVRVDSQGVVTALAQGWAYVKVSTQIDGITYSARCRVDVTGEPVAQALRGVKLGVSAVTAELYRTDYASFDVILLLEQNAGFTSVDQAPQDCGASISSARFADETMDQLFRLAVKDDRTLLVVPTEEAIQNPALVKSSYTGKVTVTIDGQDFTTDTALKLTVKKSTPKLKATALTFNAFYTRQSQPIVITGATVTGITAGADTAKAPAIPDWLILEDGALTLSPDAPAKAGSGTVKLLVDTQEWAIPASVSLSVKRAYTAPALKLSATTVTIPTFTQPDDDGYYAAGQWLWLMCKNKKDTLEGLNVSWIEAPEGWYPQQQTQNDGGFFLGPMEGQQATPGKITLKVHFSDTDRVVELPLTIKTKHTPLVVRTYLTEQKIALNTSVQDGFKIFWYTSPQYLNWNNCTLSWDIRDSKGNSVQDMFEISNESEIGVMTTSSTRPGTYYLYLDLVDKQTGQIRKTEESAVVKFTVLSSTAKPTATVKALDTIDFSFPNPKANLIISFKNFFNDIIQSVDYVVTNGNQDVTELFTLDYGDYPGHMILTPKTEVPAGTYTLKLGLKLDKNDPTAVTTYASAKITVKRTPIKLKLSKTSLSLNAATGDFTTVDVTCLTKGYTLDQPVISLMDSTGKTELTGQLDVFYEYGKLTVMTNDSTLYGATYKVLLRATEKDAPVTLTVKIPSLAQSTVSATLKVKGTLDPIRDGSSVTLTPTYKNYFGEKLPYALLTIYSSSDGKNYTTDCTDSFIICGSESGTATIAKVPGVYLDTSLKYRVVLSFPSYANSKEAYVSLPVKAGAAKLTVTGTPLLYRSDCLSRGTFTITAADKTLNAICMVGFKDPKQAALFELYDYGNGRYAIGFRQGYVQNVKYPTSVTLNVWLVGNGSAKPNATVTVKVNIQ